MDSLLWDAALLSQHKPVMMGSGVTRRFLRLGPCLPLLFEPCAYYPRRCIRFGPTRHPRPLLARRKGHDTASFPACRRRLRLRNRFITGSPLGQLKHTASRTPPPVGTAQWSEAMKDLVHAAQLAGGDPGAPTGTDAQVERWLNRFDRHIAAATAAVSTLDS
jgi:hypothetical protein